MRWNYKPRNIRLQFLVYITERRWGGNPLRHRKTQSMRLPYIVVGILTQNDHFDLFKWGLVESIKYSRVWRIDGVLPLFDQQKLPQIFHIFFGKFRFHNLFPTRFQFYSHDCSFAIAIKLTDICILFKIIHLRTLNQIRYVQPCTDYSFFPYPDRNGRPVLFW